MCVCATRSHWSNTGRVVGDAVYLSMTIEFDVAVCMKFHSHDSSDGLQAKPMPPHWSTHIINNVKYHVSIIMFSNYSGVLFLYAAIQALKVSDTVKSDSIHTFVQTLARSMYTYDSYGGACEWAKGSQWDKKNENEWKMSEGKGNDIMPKRMRAKKQDRWRKKEEESEDCGRREKANDTSRNSSATK